MMKKLIFALLLITLIQSATAQDKAAEQIVAKYAQLCADKGYLDTIRTMKAVVKVFVNEDVISATILKVAGQSYCQKSTGPYGENVRIYHKGVGIETNGTAKRTITDKAELDEMKMQSYILPDMVYKQLGFKMTLEGESKLDGVSYDIVKLVSPNGYVMTNYYEKSTGLLRIKIDPGGIRTELSDYVKIKGGLYAKTNITKLPDGMVIKVIVEEIINNVVIDPAIFEIK